MTSALPLALFAAAEDPNLRLWFSSDPAGPFEQLTPDRRFTTGDNGATTEFVYDGRNRLKTVIYPPTRTFERAAQMKDLGV